MMLPRTALVPAAVSLIVPVLLVGPYAWQVRADDEGRKNTNPAAASPTTGEFLRLVLKAVQAIDDKEVRIYCMSNLGEAQARAGDPNAARETWRQAVNLADTIRDEPWHYGPHIITWVARDQREAGDGRDASQALKKAVEIALGMKNDSAKVDFLVEIAADQRETGDLATAKETARQAIAIIKASKDELVRGFAAQNTVRAQCAAGDFEAAFRLISETEFPQHNRRGGFLSQALDLVASAVKQVDRTRDQPVLHEGFDGAPQPVLNEALQRAYTIEDPDWKGLALRHIAEAQARVRDFEGALRTARSIEPAVVQGEVDDGLAFHRGQAFVKIATAQANAGDRPGARSALDELRKWVEERENKTHRVSLLYKIANAQQEMGEFTAALTTTEALPRGLRDYLYLSIAKGQRRAGQREAAAASFQLALQDAQFRLEHGLNSDPNRPEPVSEAERAAALSSISKIRAAMGDFKGAREAAELIAGGFIREDAYRNIAQSMIENGEIQGALEWVKSLDDADLRDSALKGLAYGLACLRPGELRLLPPAKPSER